MLKLSGSPWYAPFGNISETSFCRAAVSLRINRNRHPWQPTIISAAFPDYGWLPLKYASNAAKMVTFDAISPPLAWTTPPAGTVSAALIMIDMETSSGGNPQDRLLWAVVNLPPSTRLLAENTIRGRTAMLPAGAFQLSSLTNGYIGPLPGAISRRIIISSNSIPSTRCSMCRAT